MTHLKGPLLEESHYYPFGTEMSGISSHSLPSYVPTVSRVAKRIGNRYKANAGADCVPIAVAYREYGDGEWSNGGGLEMYETYYRSYNAHNLSRRRRIGRFMQGDPMMEVSMESYAFAGNNPILFNDPFGDLSQAAWDDVLSRLGNGRNLDGFGEYGGYYSEGGGGDGGGFTPFSSDAEAFGWGASQMDANGWWGSQSGWAGSFNEAYKKFSAESSTEGEKGYNYVNAKFTGSYSHSKYTKDVELERQTQDLFYFAGYGNIFDFNAIISGYQIQQGSVGQPGALESAIPIWGSSRAAIDDFQNGNWGWGLFHTAMAVSDVFLVKSIATGIGKLAVSGAGVVASKAGGNAFRYMSKAELEAVQSTGLLRGGRAGETYFTKDLYKSAASAQNRLSLESAPTLRVEFQILNNPNLLLNGTKVAPKFGMMGKGAEFMTLDRVRVRLINWQPLR